MTNIKITKGLDIPITGAPSGIPKPFQRPSHRFHIGLDLSLFDELKFKVLVRLDEPVKIGQPLVEDKECPGRFFVSPAGGIIREIRRGIKRRLLAIVIEVAQEEEKEQHTIPPLQSMSRQELVERLLLGGLFAHIRQRPFNVLANPHVQPRSIFVKAIESAPFTPPPELQVVGYEKEFELGMEALAKLTEGTVHLVYREGTECQSFTEAKGEKHTAQGPHPIGNVSLHIERIDPITSPEDVIWTLTVHDVISIGFFLQHGTYFVSRVIGIGGPGIIEGKTGFFIAREGYPISALTAGRIKQEPVQLISGDPLMGHEVQGENFLGFDDTVVCAIPENTKREFLHFFRAGANKYTFSGAYLSGLFPNPKKKYFFTTNQHGEHRAFIDSTLYDDVVPLHIPTMPLVRAVMAEDYDLAVELGLLEVDSEDFALPSFVCPSKIEMVDIIKEGLRRYANDILK